MANSKPPDRNPTILPDKPAAKKGCPKCSSMNYKGWVAWGAPTYQCLQKDCGNVWQGGIIHESPVNPNQALPPPTYTPPLQFEKPLVKGGGSPDNPNFINPDVVEVRRRVDPTPDFRKGGLIPEDEDY
jgi:hypothetical protein